MKKYILLISSIAISFLSYSQITTSPALPTASNEVVITFDATQGNGNLAGYTGDIYAHTGVKIEGTTSWQYVVGVWGNNTTQPKLTRISTNTYTLTIAPSVREFYNVPSDKKIVQMCFVFRASTNSPQSEDLFVNVVEEGLTVKINTPTVESPFFNYESAISVNVKANSASSLTLLINNTEVVSTQTSSVTYSHSIDRYGLQWIKAIASDGENSVADSVYFYVRGTAPIANLPQNVRAGINVTGANEVTLVLHDPPAKKEFVFAIGDFSSWLLDDDYLMNRTPDGKHYWVTLTDLDPQKEYVYQYWIDGELKIADPYTEKIVDPWNDKYISSTIYPNPTAYPEGKTTGIASVFQAQQDEYQWEATDFTAPPKGDLVIYELHIRDFVTDSHVLSVIDKLDYLHSLGVNAIELMPINEFEGNDSWGYNPSFYFATDKAYGTPNRYKQFIDECHKRNIAVIIDMVLNHSYGQSPLVQMYFDPHAGNYGQPSADNPWYNQVSPNQEYSWGNDFNHESQYTKDFIDRVNRYWIEEFKVDGFRFDFTKGFTNTPGNGWAYDAARINILKRMADRIWDVNPNAYVILEHFADNNEERTLSEYKADEGKGMLIWGNLNHNYNEASMGWLNDSNFSGVSYKQRGWSYPHLVGYMESHDEERIMFKNKTYGNSTNAYHDVKTLGIALNRQRLTAAFFFTIPGPKMIWQFGELGYDISIDYNGRTGRKPIHWDYLEDTQRLRLYYDWAELINLRKSLSAFRTNNFSLALSGAGKRITLLHNDMNIVVVGNFDVVTKDISVAFPNTGQWYEYFSQSNITLESTEKSFTMEPGEYRIYSTVYIDRKNYAVSAPIPEVDLYPFRIDCWPNPASSNLNITVNCKKPESGNIMLYDISGRFVSRIHMGKLNLGENTYNWIKPKEIGNGVYFIVVQTDTNRRSRRVILH